MPFLPEEISKATGKLLGRASVQIPNKRLGFGTSLEQEVELEMELGGF